MAFSLKRTFLTANNKYVTTKMSQKFYIKLISGSSLLTKIKFTDPYEEMEYNNISEKFKPYSYTIYCYPIIAINTSYNFSEPKINSNISWGSTNGLQNNFVNPNSINHHRLNTLQNVNSNKYRLFKMGTYFYDNSNNTIYVKDDLPLP